MATPYIKNDGANYKIQAGLPTGGVDTLQFTDSASSFTQTLPAATGTLALTTIATGANAIVTTDMAAAFRALDGLVMPNVLGYLTNTPPGSPAMGDCYIIGAAPTGAWAGQAGKVTRYSTTLSAWEFFTPRNGWLLQSNIAREAYRYTGSAWEYHYQEGTWTPTPTNLGGTGITYSTKYVQIGYRVDFQCTISGTNLTSTANSTRITGPFTAARTSICAADNGSGVGGIAEVFTSSIFLPTISATSQINVSGVIFLN